MSMTDKKMTGKQAVVGNFDLDAFVGGSEAPTDVVKSPSKATSKPKEAKPSAATKKPAEAQKIKPEAPVKLLLSQRAQIRMTDEEYKKIEAAAGLIPVSTFLRKFLQDNELI